MGSSCRTLNPGDPELKGYCHSNLFVFFDLKSQILYFIVIQNEWHHHQPY